MIMKHKTIPIFVSHMGCPNDCSFCNQRKITGHSEIVTPELADKIIRDSLKTIKENENIEIGYFGGSFTGIEEKLQEELLKTAYKYIKSGDVNSIRVSTRPDYIDKNKVDMLKIYGTETVELGAQSMDDSVLLANRRGHTSYDTVSASKTILSGGLKLGLQMMTGLYKDTNQGSINTAQELINLSPSCVRIYPTLVLKGTYLEELYKNSEYKPQTLEEAVCLCADLKDMFFSENIPVIRMGLMSSDNINPDNDVVAGPYHPSFGELVQSKIYLKKLIKNVKKDCTIEVNPKSVSAFVGNKKCNIYELKKLGFDVNFVQNDKVLPDDFKIL